MGRKSIWLLTIVGAVVAAQAHGLQAGPAVVRNAKTLHLRSGAGTDFASIGVLHDGDRVEIKSINVPWATVRTTTGGVGYVRIEYLANQPGAKARDDAPVKAPPAETAQPAPQPSAADAPALDELRSLRERNAKLEADLESVRSQLAALQGQASKPTVETDALRADLARVLTVTEEIHRRLNQKVDAVAADTPERPLVDQNVVLLAAACVVFGVLLGGGYGRLQERSRRTRIRL